VELHPVERGVLVDGASVRGPASQCLPVGFSCPAYVGVGDVGEPD
jgi:hypothetical protein